MKQNILFPLAWFTRYEFFNFVEEKIFGGFYGLVGSGRTELIRTILNIDKRDAGDIFLRGEKIELIHFKTALHKYKIGYVTENRKEEGLIFGTLCRNEYLCKFITKMLLQKNSCY